MEGGARPTRRATRAAAAAAATEAAAAAGGAQAEGGSTPCIDLDKLGDKPYDKPCIVARLGDQWLEERLPVNSLIDDAPDGYWTSKEPIVLDLTTNTDKQELAKSIGKELVGADYDDMAKIAASMAEVLAINKTAVAGVARKGNHTSRHQHVMGVINLALWVHIHSAAAAPVANRRLQQAANSCACQTCVDGGNTQATCECAPKCRCCPSLSRCTVLCDSPSLSLSRCSPLADNTMRARNTGEGFGIDCSCLAPAAAACPCDACTARGNSVSDCESFGIDCSCVAPACPACDACTARGNSVSACESFGVDCACHSDAPSCSDQVGWSDGTNGCSYYASQSDACASWGDIDYGQGTAKENCCACGVRSSAVRSHPLLFVNNLLVRALNGQVSCAAVAAAASAAAAISPTAATGGHRDRPVH